MNILFKNNIHEINVRLQNNFCFGADFFMTYTKTLFIASYPSDPINMYCFYKWSD